MRGYLVRADEAAILVGNDEMIWPGIAMGASGLVSSLANLFPELYVQLFEACDAGDQGRARELQRWVWRLAEVCHRATPLAYVKRGLAILGIDVGEPLPPLRDLSAAETAALERDLRAFQEGWNRVFREGGGS
ncbi:dihydrodipicolinate synthase family protein [Candidatus Bipolaricaulota bacterium]|nr:dihydrodipicolinate synthase family protein [Candidatus Bipolaricaulota bacterium]